MREGTTLTRVLLVSGLGPSFDLDRYFAGSLLDDSASARLQHTYFSPEVPAITLDRLECRDEQGARRPLLRRLATHDVPHLTTATLTAIVTAAGAEVTSVDLDRVWRGDTLSLGEHDAVFLSTSFICNRAALRTAIGWIRDHSDAPLVLGGQYSNLKYAEILRDYPEVAAVIRGDGEHTVPALVARLGSAGGNHLDFDGVPNAAYLDPDGSLRVAPLTYVDLMSQAAPSFVGTHPIVPYESMRGCPYSCKFCSFPAASPKFRYRSAETIVSDWRRYHEVNAATQIRALDSIFTIPHTRMRELATAIAAESEDFPTWEGFSRAATIKDADYVAMLESARCHQLSIGFESMSDDVLGYMGKRVSVAQNRRANELLRGSAVGCRGHFMVGYPGERPEDFALTADYLARDYAGEFKLSVFSFTDETMPVWSDADRFGIEIDPEHPEFGWRHNGMDVHEALNLHHDTIRRVRWASDEAVWLFWQRDFELPLVPGTDRWTDLYVQKLVERLIMTPVDHPDPVVGTGVIRGLLAQLRLYGVRLRRNPVAA